MLKLSRKALLIVIMNYIYNLQQSLWFALFMGRFSNLA